ncbi:MAG TPA: septal ring lytic transglycosylase RlpA family protein [Stellaceae bacterium]|nr:septal ring lytic transglycosylase RlpA family protein [Stellaceae bacterium]
MRALYCLALMALLSASAAAPAQAAARARVQACPSREESVVYKETGLASWYAPRSLRRRTASGERSAAHGLTAAHRTLPLGSVVHVVNLENCRSVRVTVNDRGPFGRRHRPRILDLSESAGLALGIKRAGLAHVRVERYASDKS